jgi:hypothetical protein
MHDVWTEAGGSITRVEFEYTSLAASDTCAGALPAASSQTGTTVGATNDGSSTCDATGNDVWYTYTAGATGGQLRLDTCGSAIDTVLSVYTGACGALTEIACNDDATGVPCAAPASALSVVLASSQTVRIRLSDKGVGGAFTLNTSYAAFQANDNCASATQLISNSATGNTVTATRDGTSPCDPTGNDVWFSYTMGAVAGGIDFDTCGSAVDTVLSVYSSCGGALLGCDDNSGGCSPGAALVTVPLNAGQTVLVRVSDKGVGGAYVLNWRFTPPASVCATPSGAGGPFPTSGTGDGTYPTTLPTFPLSSPLAVTVPPGSTQIVKLKLNGMYHTWAGDVQFVLQDPAGASHNLWCRFGGSNDFGLPGSSTGFDYEIYELFGSNPTTAPNPIPAGPYTQSFGTWPSGTNNIFNTPLSQIPVSNGTYTLHIYDWAGGDIGVLGSWEICFNGSSGPVSFCTSGTSTNGCVPAISANAQPSASLAGNCTISVANVEGQKSGLIFYGIDNTGFAPLAWGTGSTSFLCVKPPTQRMIFQSSGGSIGACDGSLTQDVHAFLGGNPAALGQPFAAGGKMFAQAWYRDPQAVKTTNLSNALELTFLP